MMLLRTIVGMVSVLNLAIQSTAQSGSALVCDINGNNCYQQLTVGDDLVFGLALPPATASPTTEFLGIIQGSLEDYGYAGWSMDGALQTVGMLWVKAPHGSRKRDGDPDTSRIFTARNLEDDELEPYSGPVFTILNGTTMDNSTFTTVFRCQNYFGDAFVNPNLSSSAAPISLIISSTVPDPVNSSDAFIPYEGGLFQNFTIDFAGARVSDYFSRI